MLSNTKLSLWLSALALLVICLILVVFRDPQLSLLNSILATLALIITVTPSIQYVVTSPDKRPIIPFLPLVGIFYLSFFVLPIFYFYKLASSPSFQGNAGRPVSKVYVSELQNESIILILIGMLVFQCGWLMVKSRLFSFVPKFLLPQKTPPHHLLILAVGLLLGSLSYYYVDWISDLPSVGQFFVPAGYAGIGLLLLISRRKDVSWVLSIPIIIFFGGGLFFSFVASGFISSIAYLVIFLLVLDFWSSKKIKKIYGFLALITSLLVFLVYPVSSQIRAIIWHQDLSLSLVEKIKIASHIVYDTYLGEDENYIFVASAVGLSDGGSIKFGSKVIRNGHALFSKDKLVNVGRDYMLHRVSKFSILNYVIEKTPEEIPFLSGATYETLFVSVVPRFFWSDKPEEKWGNEFGQRYALIGQNDRQTSMNIGWITELYANFGWRGIILGMFLFGIILSILERFFMHSGASVSEVAIGTTILLPLFYQESNFTLMTGSIITLTLCMWMYFHIGAKGLMIVSKLFGLK